MKNFLLGILTGALLIVFAGCGFLALGLAEPAAISPRPFSKAD